MHAINIFNVDKPEGRTGRSPSPYHYEYEEEWLLVVDGTLVLRAPDGEHTLEGGDLVTGRTARRAGTSPRERGDFTAQDREPI